MKDLLDRLSSYNLFNYLLPGVLFAFVAEATTSLRLLQKDLLVGVFIYYFLGAVISRIGSLVLEPLLLRAGIVTFTPYEDYVRTAKIDTKLEVLSEANNTYRTFSALFLCVAAVAGFDATARSFPVIRAAAQPLLVGGLFLLFCLAYRKQTGYIRKRVAENLNESRQVILGR